jgi:glycosyltransferase involved in cell wall biosynthesis
MSESPKTILFLITKSNWGGAQRYVFDIATNLDRTHFTPVVALGGHGILKQHLEAVGIETITIPSLTRDVSFFRELSSARALFKILRTVRPDIVHVNSSKVGVLGTILSRLTGVERIIFTAHGWAFNEDRPWWQKKLITFLHWLTVVCSHVTISVSHALMKELPGPFVQKRFVVINPGRTITHILNPSEARERIISIHPTLSSHRQLPWLLTIAELHPIKRLPILLEAMFDLKKSGYNFVSVIIGEGETRVELETIIKKLSLEDTVYLVGTIPEAAELLPAGDIFILPSKSESYGYVVLEAGLQGVPVIATRVGGIPDIVTDDSLGTLIPPENADRLQRELESFLKNPQPFLEKASRLKVALAPKTVSTMVRATEAMYTNPTTDSR